MDDRDWLSRNNIPFYPSDSDYTTNAPSYYENLARKTKLIKMLAEKIWGYEEKLDITLEELETRLETYITENDSVMTERLNDWDKRLEKFPENVESLLEDWLSDGTLDHIINDTIFNWKVDKTEFDEFVENTTTQLAQTTKYPLLDREVNVSDTGYPYGDVRRYGAKGDGLTNDIPAFQSAVDSLSDDGGNIVVDGSSGEVYLFDFFNGGLNPEPTVYSPTRVLIKERKNVNVTGKGSPLIKMLGFTREYQNSIPDVHSSGRDIFTAFSFMESDNCKIEGINFVGEWQDGDDYGYNNPRQKAVTFIASTNSQATKLVGRNIRGNLVHSAPSMAVVEGHYKESSGLIVSDCQAFDMGEGGINFMGGTNNMQVSNCYTYNCSQGFEGGTTGLTITNNIFEKSRYAGFGFATAKDVTATNNLAKDSQGFGIQMATMTNALISNNIIMGSTSNAIHIISGGNDLTISNNDITNNNTDPEHQSERYVILVQGSNGRINDITIKNNRIKDDLEERELEEREIVGGIFFNNVDHCRAIDNVIYIVNETAWAIQGASSNTYYTAVGNISNLDFAHAAEVSTRMMFNNESVFKQETDIPTSGKYRRGAIVLNTRAYKMGSSPNRYFILGWYRMTNGDTHVVGVDWDEIRIPVVE